MRIIIACALLCGYLISCSSVATNQESENKTDSTAAAVVPKTSAWNLPLDKAWQGEADFILTIPDGNGLDLMTEATPHKTDDLLTDTLQGIVLERMADPLLKDGCEPTMRSMKVVLGGGRKQGWVRAEQVYTIRKRDIATYTHDGKPLKVGIMEPWYQGEDGDCSFIHMLFLYDEQYLYLIDAEGTDFDLHWKDAKHLSIVNSLENISIEGKQEDNVLLLFWGEPNVRKELRLFWARDHVKYQSHTTLPESDVDDLAPDDHIEAEAEIQTITCTLQNAGLGDCFHLEFDCGDFGSARVELTGAEADLWNDLAIEKEGDEEVNPKYKGKQFEITYQWVVGPGCGDPNEDHSQDQIQRVIGFKLKK